MKIATLQLTSGYWTFTVDGQHKNARRYISEQGAENYAQSLYPNEKIITATKRAANMTREHTITAYTFAELPEKVKEELRSKAREALDSAYYADVIEVDYTAICELLGFADVEFRWAGFSSQGDGAMFTGIWDAASVNAQALRDYAPQDTKLHGIADALATIAAAEPNASATLTHSGHYSHENTACFVCEDFTDIQHEETFCDMSRAIMGCFYAALEREYDYNCEDAQIDESIESRDDEYTENGALI